MQFIVATDIANRPSPANDRILVHRRVTSADAAALDLFRAPYGRSWVSMCGRFTLKMTWGEIVTLYKVTLDGPPHKLQHPE